MTNILKFSVHILFESDLFYYTAVFTLRTEDVHVNSSVKVADRKKIIKETSEFWGKNFTMTSSS